MQRQLTVINNRYLCLSYTPAATGNYTHTIVVDMVQGRYGKLKHLHTQLIEFRSLEVGSNLDTHGRFGMLTESGQIDLVDFDLQGGSAHSGVMLFGKLQLLRQRMCQLQTVELENLVPGLNFSISDLVSYNGKDYDTSIAGTGDSNTASRSRVFGFGSPVGMNHTLALKGQFNIQSLLAHVNVHGYAGGIG